VEGSVLADVSGRQSEGHGLGAYSAESDTIFLSRDLLNTDPAKAEKILSEEVGHSLDAKLNIDDTAGDEGEIFARLSHGESVSADELRSLKAENDAGTIVVNGKEIEVEYGWNPLKKVGKFLKKGVSSIGRSIKKGVKSIGRAVKKGFTKLVNSRLIGVVLQVAKFIPIPVVQGIAHIVNIAKMGYSLYQGVKHRSIGAIVGGIAGVASGVAKFGGFIGSNGPWVSTAANLAEKAGVASTAYRVLSEKDIGAALRYISGTVGTDNSLADVVNGLTKVNAVYEAQKSGDFIGAINAGSLLLQDFTDSKGDELLQRITHNATTISKFKEAYEKGDFVGALNVLGAEISADQGEGGDNSKPVIDALRVIGNVQIIKTLMDDGDYAAAALRLIETATLTTSSSKTREALEDAARTINAVDLAIQSGKSGDYKQAMDYAEIALGRPLDDKTRARVSHVYENARHLNSLVRSIDSSDIAGGIMSLRMLLANPSPSPLTGLLNTTGLMMKESEHLLAAIDRKDYRQAVTKASEIARLLPRGSELASTFDTLSMLLSNEAWVLRERNNPEAITGAQH
nr:hypothetical protein [Granulosicoccus sp.]